MKSVAAPVSERKEKEPSTVLSDADSPKRRSTPHTIHSLCMMRLLRTDSWWRLPLVQLPEESQSQYYAPRKAFFTLVSCHELFVRCVEKTTNKYKTAKCCLPQFTSVEVELPQQLMSIGKPLVLAIFGSELAILTTFCCFIFICRFLHASHE